MSVSDNLNDRVIFTLVAKMEEEDACVYTIDDDFTIDVEEDTDDILKNHKFPKVATQDSKETQYLVNEVPTATVSGPTRKYPFWKCELCSYRTIHEPVFRRHVEMHADPTRPKLHKCKNCDYQTFLKSTLSHHMARCASNERKIKCPDCDFCTLRRRNLTSHIMNKHNPAKPKVYKCRKCSFKTEELGEYEGHTKNEHKEKCPMCQFETDRKKKLEVHMKSHNPKVKNVRVYKCDTCSYESLWPTNVVRHRERHHVQQ